MSQYLDDLEVQLGLSGKQTTFSSYEGFDTLLYTNGSYTFHIMDEYSIRWLIYVLFDGVLCSDRKLQLDSTAQQISDVLDSLAI